MPDRVQRSGKVGVVMGESAKFVQCTQMPDADHWPAQPHRPVDRSDDGLAPGRADRTASLPGIAGEQADLAHSNPAAAGDNAAVGAGRVQPQ